ncbi:unnamed protein product [Closterium sp. Naga37s-1]|nr:unnamed protein product [Closterium sp. Naga37s-1]CAI5495833.1 unnamed protein product [Closterium sp. Naga37s-1]
MELELKSMWEELERVKQLARAAGQTPRSGPNIDGATSGLRGSVWDINERGNDATHMRDASAVVRQLLTSLGAQEQSPVCRSPAAMQTVALSAKPTQALSEMNSQALAVPLQQTLEVQGESTGPPAATAAAGGKTGPEGAGGTLVPKISYAGVHLLRDGLWHVKLVKDPKNPSTIMLGSYEDQLVAARAFAAAVHVVRRHQPIRGRVLPLHGADLEILKGCTTRHVEFLARRRAWGRWERWQTEIEEMGGLPAEGEVGAAAAQTNETAAAQVHDSAATPSSEPDVARVTEPIAAPTRGDVVAAAATPLPGNDGTAQEDEGGAATVGNQNQENTIRD